MLFLKAEAARLYDCFTFFQHTAVLHLELFSGGLKSNLLSSPIVAAQEVESNDLPSELVMLGDSEKSDPNPRPPATAN